VTTGAGGVLYVVGTPIGNLEDVTLRALRVLREVDLIAAEDTRRTARLLAHHGISRPLTSYYDAVERARAPRIVERLRGGAKVALVSDAGTPGIADPGFHVVRAAVAAGIPVVPIPGPSAVTALVSVAGLPVDRFVFEGFLPTRPGPRRARLRALREETRAIVFFEAARRLEAFVEAAVEVLGDRETVLARELTKLHEEFVRGPLSAVCERRAATGKPLKGEVSLVVEGAPLVARVASPGDLDAEIRAALAAGQRVRELAPALARRLGRSRREVYQRALTLERG